MLMAIYHSSRKTLKGTKEWVLPYFRRFLRLLALPHCYISRVNWAYCTASPLRVAGDLLHIFFHLKCYPENYSKCRLWTMDRSRWPLYYASLTDSYQRRQLAKVVQPAEYRVVFADKELCHHLCASLGLPVPKFLGCVDPEDDFKRIIRDRLGHTARREMIAKPVRGVGGHGVQVIQEEQGEIVAILAGKRMPLDQMEIHERMILEELVIQHPNMAEVYADSVNTLRIQTLLTKDGEAIVLGCLARFGRNRARVDNLGSGGIGLGVHASSGRLFPEGWDYAEIRYDRHPETGVVFDGFRIPRWDELIALVKRAQEHFPFYRLLGFDIAITLEGPVIIEINPQPDNVNLEASCGPILAEARTLREFERYGLLVNAPTRALARAAVN